MTKERRYECQDKAEDYRRKYVNPKNSYRKLFSPSASRCAPIPIEEEVKMWTDIPRAKLLEEYENGQIDVEQQMNVDSVFNDNLETKQTSTKENQAKSIRKKG